MPKDCSDLRTAGSTTNGVYTIYPHGGTRPLTVYCDMGTNGQAWIVIQRRTQINNPQNYFLRTWKEYKHGFGTYSGEFWLGA
ncbi:hypothetical protein LAZ67_3002216 [Cordylochernes scorpioides]|uniref:Fibrinogen C-terminal domain-containing protein n=1 Tax=Cordylochernes scorpioides TaxID=51811 RepID=A0ABY6K8A3_9ARAC|nr:hypothetical protein LAZ67_3002216 [Cordylochernes scorpioides]